MNTIRIFICLAAFCVQPVWARDFSGVRANIEQQFADQGQIHLANLPGGKNLYCIGGQIAMSAMGSNGLICMDDERKPYGVFTAGAAGGLILVAKAVLIRFHDSIIEGPYMSAGATGSYLGGASYVRWISEDSLNVADVYGLTLGTGLAVELSYVIIKRLW